MLMRCQTPGEKAWQIPDCLPRVSDTWMKQTHAHEVSVTWMRCCQPRRCGLGAGELDGGGACAAGRGRLVLRPSPTDVARPKPAAARRLKNPESTAAKTPPAKHRCPSTATHPDTPPHLPHAAPPPPLSLRPIAPTWRPGYNLDQNKAQRHPARTGPLPASREPARAACPGIPGSSE